MAQLKSAYEITMELSKLFHDKNKSDEEVREIVYKYSRIFAEELFTTPEAFTEALMVLRSETPN